MPTSDSYWRIKALFAEALDRPPAERAAFVAAACAGDAGLREQVEALLVSHDHAAGLVRPTSRDSTLPPHIPVELPGTIIGPYTTRELIGEGGMGVVYKAEQRSPIHRFVALKLIKLGMDTRQVIARFDSERQALALMNHPNVAAVYDAGATETGRPYFVMEYVAGTPITSFCDRHKYTTKQRLELFVQACDAIQHAHQKAIIHRDVKPGNILVTLVGDKPVVKVIDFGVAKATAHRLTEHTVFTETGQLVGTPEYMSPEQAEMNPLDVDTRTDIYSLGVVLYQLLVGALPFDSSSLRRAAYAQIQAIIREVDPPRPSTRLSSMKGEAAAEVAAHRGTHANTLAKELRGELEWIPMKAMRKDRARRYHTANDLAQDVRNYLDQKPLIAGPESGTYRLRKFLSRNRGPVSASALVFVVLIAGIIGTTMGMIGQSRQRVIAEQQRAAAQHQEQEAKRQAAIATAVSDFQTDMLDTADPKKLMGDKVTVLQAITAAVNELDAGKLSAQPTVEAAVRSSIGDTLRTLGRYDKAEPNLRRALELRRSALPAGHPDLTKSVTRLALLMLDQGKLAEAEDLFDEAQELREIVMPAGDGEIARGLNNIAAVLFGQGKYAEAEARFRKALDINRKALPAGDQEIATTLNNLAVALRSQEKLREAEALLRESLDLRRQGLPANHPNTAATLQSLAQVLQASGQLANAEPFYREALAIRREVMPARHPDIAMALNNLCSLLQAQGKFAETEPLAREALEICREALPAGHPGIASTADGLAEVLRAQNKQAEAEPLIREALAIRLKALPAGHPEIAASLQNLSVIVFDQKKFDEATSCYREALTYSESAFGKNDSRVGANGLGLGIALLELRRPADAEPVLLEAERVLSSSPNVPAGKHNESVRALVALYTQWDVIEPDKGHRAQIEQWKSQLSEKDATTIPATTTP